MTNKRSERISESVGAQMTLLKLLRMALGTGTDMTLPAGTPWREVVRLSYEHKVSAIAVDGMKASGCDPYRGLDAPQAEELKKVLTPWFDDVANAERSYEYYLEVLNTLCQIFVNFGLTPIILKGYGLSLNYPVPGHRGAGDIDIFLVDREGRPAAGEGNRIAKEVLGLEVELEDDEHHSHFTFKGILVENHYDLLGAKRGGEREIEFGRMLSEMLSTQGRGHTGPVMPSPTFNALFLLRHMFSHFLANIFTFRQLTDHILLLRRFHDSIDWEYVEHVTARYGLKPFAEALYGFYRDVLGVEESILPPSFTADSAVSESLLMDILHFREVPCDGIHIFRHYYLNPWHYRFFFGHRNWFDSVIRHIAAYIRIHSGNLMRKMTSVSLPVNGGSKD